MTRVDRSPEQLNAEAAAPQEPLSQRIALHRKLYTGETIYRLHDRYGDPGGGYDPDNDDPKPKPRANGWGAGATGLPFSAAFRRHLSGSTGLQFPYATAVKAMWVECRRAHAEHKRSEWRGSLCRTLIDMTVAGEWNFDRACLAIGVHPERTERTMHHALNRIESKLAELEMRATEPTPRSAAEWMAPEHVHHAVPGLHEQDCRQCQRRTAA